MLHLLLLAVVCGLSVLDTASAQCQPTFGFASYYGSHMVLQRPPARPRIWGYATAVGEQVTVSLNSGVETVIATAVAGPEGRPVWEATFNPISAVGPHQISITSGTCTLTLTNILIGDVYICSGQSNMQHRLDNIDDPQPDIDDVVNYPWVRTFQNSLEESNVPLYDLKAIDRTWAEPTTSNMPAFSAVCWLFGKHLFEKYGRPVGLIMTCWGGTRIEAWMSPEALDVCSTSVEGGGSPERDPNDASALYNAMIHPFLPMPIYGGIWYQGESNQGNANMYGCLIKAMVGDWRARWNAENPEMDDNFPFGQVQLAPNGNNDASTGFPDVRWYQTDTFGYTPNANMNKFFDSVAIDLPDFNSPYGAIHPRYKRQIAWRLALAVFNVGYGSTDTGIYQGPLPTAIALDGANVRVNFNVALQYRDTSSIFELCCGASPTATCGAGGRWVVSPFVQGNTQDILIGNTCAGGESVTGYRYLWRESPCKTLEACPIYSVENSLPAPPFLYNGAVTKGKTIVL